MSEADVIQALSDVIFTPDRADELRTKAVSTGLPVPAFFMPDGTVQELQPFVPDLKGMR